MRPFESMRGARLEYPEKAAPIAHRVAGVLIFRMIVNNRQEVGPMNAVSAMGAPPQSTIARLS